MAWSAVSFTVGSTAAVEQQAYVVASGKKFTCTSFNAVNKNVAATTIRYGISNGGVLVDGEWKSYEESLSYGTPLRLKPGWVIPAGYEIRVEAANNDVDFSGTGILENE